MVDRLITSYTGFPSFFNAPIKEAEQVVEGMTVIAGVPIDQGVVIARPGARYGPRAIREASMLFRGAYEVAAELLAAQEVDLIHLAGTPPFMMLGCDGERALLERWRARFKIPVFAAPMSDAAALRALGATKLVGVTYSELQNELSRDYMIEAGFDVLENAGIDVPFEQAGNLSHHEVYRHTKAAAQRHPEADGILLFGSGWRSLDAIELLEQDLEIPVAHPVPARVWTVQKRLRVVEPVSGYGRLLEEMP